MRNILIFLFVLTSINLIAQQKFSQELKFVNDNDLYISFEKDRYYTNGMFLSYSYVSTSTGKSEKKIQHWSLNHKMYTPFKSVVLDPKSHDRPFAAYLYGSYGVTNVYSNKHLLKMSFDIGVLGPSAGGEDLQVFIHNIYNFDKAVGWKYQIEDTFGLNANATYLIPLNKTPSTSFDSHGVFEAKIGTIFNELSSGIYSRIGLKSLAKSDNSLAFNTHLNNDQSEHVRNVESFLYFNPMLTYVISDATLEGSLFQNNSLITAIPKKLRFQMELGYKFTAGNWILGYSYILHSQKAKNLRHQWNDYGQLTFAYLFR